MTQGNVRGFIESHFKTQGVVDWSLLEGTSFTLVECPQCALIYQAASPNDATLEAIYTQMIGSDFLEDHEQSLLTVSAFQEVAGELALLFRRLNKAPSQVTFLDYGFGYGRWARVARALGATVYATEIGDEKARAAAALGVRMITDDEIDQMTFDIVHTEQVFEHLPEPGETFHRLARATTGLLKVAVPRGGPVASVLKARGMTDQSPFARGGRVTSDDRVFMAIQPLEHINVFAPKTMAWLAHKNGLRLISQTRRATVAVDVTNARSLLRSIAALGKAAARECLKPKTGYYLFEPSSSKHELTSAI